MKLEQIIETIKTGSRGEVKEAKQKLEKCWGFWRENKKTYLPFLEEIKNFEQIKRLDNQAAFISALKWVFWTFGDDHFDFLKQFALKILQHHSGRLRQVMIYSAGYLKFSLDLLSPSLKKLSKKQIEKIQNNKIIFCQWVEEIEDLMERYYEPRFEKYKYVSSMPASVYKSLQIFYDNLLARPIFSEMYMSYQYDKQKTDLARQEDRVLGDNFILETKEEADRNKKWDYYYDAMDSLSAGDPEMSHFLLDKAIEMDEDFTAAYVGLTEVYRVIEDMENEKEYAFLAFEKTKKVFPKWPKEMLWGVLENRQYLRAIANKAMVLHKLGELKEAEKIYRLTLKLCPSDNQGMRYQAAGMFQGFKPQDIDKMFDEGNDKQDWRKLENLVKEQNKKHHFWQPPDFM